MIFDFLLFINLFELQELLFVCLLIYLKYNFLPGSVVFLCLVEVVGVVEVEGAHRPLARGHSPRTVLSSQNYKLLKNNRVYVYCIM